MAKFIFSTVEGGHKWCCVSDTGDELAHSARLVYDLNVLKEEVEFIRSGEGKRKVFPNPEVPGEFIFKVLFVWLALANSSKSYKSEEDAQKDMEMVINAEC